ncbi:MAG: PAS domain S-box protein [Candidatus Omnitrophica bacterium]|jgi:PAS domain S-box-containing protein|nr:PAS domain S-box protein [Candidatus Omnitrophota bacterium]
MKIRVRIFFAICAVVVISSLFFTIAGYKAQEKALLGGVDQKLYTAALMLKAILPDDYHDSLSSNSFTQEDYDAIIVARNNKLCKELGLQYLWSSMVVDGKIVFTTSTSPSKDISKNDHAKFFKAHSDPESFAKAFRTMKPAYSSFYNEWGHGRMVLIPFVSKKGNLYCLGASMSTNELAAVLRGTLMEYILFFSIAIIFGFIVSILIAGTFSEPIEKLQQVADDIAHGKFEQKAQITGCKEFESLCESLNFMSNSINENVKMLRSSEERFRNLAESLSDFIWEVDENTICRYVSKKVEDLLGFTVDEVLGKVPFAFTDNDDEKSNKVILKTLIASHEPFRNVVHKYRHKNGSLVIIESSGVPIFDSAGNFKGYRGIDRDVTDRYKLEREREDLIASLQKNKTDLEKVREELVAKTTELTEANKELKVANEDLGKATKELKKTKIELEVLNVDLEKRIDERTKDLRQAQEKLIRSEKLASLGKAAGSLSHELRNPLGVISNAIYYLTSSGVVMDNAKLEKYLNIIKSQIRDANNIIETALDFAKAKSMVFGKNNLNKCVEEALAKLVVPKNITIRKNFGKNLDVVFDAVYMCQAIVDVVKNSIEAIEGEGFVEISTSIDSVEAKVAITDNGKGIGQNDINSVFEPLFSRKARGIGLGLSIVKDIVSAHNGVVTAESTPGAGTTIIIRFPVRQNT